MVGYQRFALTEPPNHRKSFNKIDPTAKRGNYLQTPAFFLVAASSSQKKTASSALPVKSNLV